MARFESKFFSIVFLGRMNPAILNHDFLMLNNIIPSEEEPFRSLLKRETGKQFSEFLSTPVMATIRYDKIPILIEEERYQIADHTSTPPHLSPIIQITKNYFGKVLKYTPLRIGGFNFNGVVSFDSQDDENAFDEKLGLHAADAKNLLSVTSVQMSGVIRYPFLEGTSEIKVSKPKKPKEPTTLNYNYEFESTKPDELLSRLDRVKEIHNHFLDILKKIKLEISQ
jgi:hypothetical protein